MTKSAPDAPFTLKRVQEMLGLSRTVVAGLISQGFVAPARGPRNEHRFSFQDLMLLRTAHALQRANIPPRKILRSLAKLKADLPPELPLTGLRITAVGADVAVRDRSGQWHADSGQLLMDFEVAEVSGTVSFIQRASVPASASLPAANDWFKRGEALEATDVVAAEDAYRRAIEAEPDAVDSYLNLGAMLCDARRCDEAVTLYEKAVAHVQGDPFLHFNHAIALEDQERPDEALAAYARALAIDGSFADAHYNSGVLLENQAMRRALFATSRLIEGFSETTTPIRRVRSAADNLARRLGEVPQRLGRSCEVAGAAHRLSVAGEQAADQRKFDSICNAVAAGIEAPGAALGEESGAAMLALG